MVTAAMERALGLALEARAAGDHPFGAVLEVDGVVVAEARNLVTTTHDITAHAETELLKGLFARGDALEVLDALPPPRTAVELDALIDQQRRKEAEYASVGV